MNRGKLFQQFIVDAYACIEEKRLDFIQRNQKQLRSELYYEIREAFLRGDCDGNRVGKSVILPSNYISGPRYMLEHYHDAMAICKFYGYSDLFITFAHSPAWLEIKCMLSLILGQKAEDQQNIVVRVF